MTMTDYSSIIVDFIENNIPTVLFQFDFQKFTSFRKMRPLSNIDKIETLFSLKELEIFLRSKSNSYVDRTNFRDIEQEKSIWVAFIADLLKSS
jgi:CDP-glycerol glycerophosphotransferase (TagB/SpsB family)